MLDRKKNLTFKWTLFCFVSYFFIFTFFLSGCEPLRKKFKRSKKKEKEVAEIPVLEPIDYPKKIYNTTEVYKKHYSLWRAWHQDLSESLMENAGRKRQLYLWDQTVNSLLEMQKVLPKDKQMALEGSLKRLQRVRADLEATVPQRSTSALRGEVDSIDKEIRKNFSFNKIQGSLKGP